MGAYGPIVPGSYQEDFAFIGLRDYQRERMLETKLLSHSSAGVKPEELNKIWKEYIKAADPFTDEEIKKADKRKMSLLDSEIKKGSFKVTPLVDTSGDEIMIRSKPRIKKGRRYR